MARSDPSRLVALLAGLLSATALLLDTRPARGAEDGASSTPNASTDADDHTDEPPADSSDTTSKNGTDAFFSDAHRRALYERERLKPGHAILWNLAFPGLGNFYAQQYLLGGLFGGFATFGAIFTVWGLTSGQDPFVWTGIATAGAMYPLSIGTSLVGVRAQNAELRQSLKVSTTAGEQPAPPHWVTLDIRF